MELSSALQNIFKGKNAFNEILEVEGEVFREHKNRRTVRIIRDGKGYFVKVHRNIGWREIIKNLFSLRLPVLSAGNELRAIRKLDALGIETMKVAGFGERGHPPAWLESFLITEELENTIEPRTFLQGMENASAGRSSQMGSHQEYCLYRPSFARERDEPQGFLYLPLSHRPQGGRCKEWL